MYFQRRKLDRRALTLLDEIREQRIGRHEHARTFAQELSWDVWDALKLESEIPIPAWFRDGPHTVQSDLGTVPQNALPRRFWAKTVMGVISRYHVTKMYARCLSPTEGDSVSFEEGLSGLSAFFDESPFDVSLL